MLAGRGAFRNVDHDLCTGVTCRLRAREGVLERQRLAAFKPEATCFRVHVRAAALVGSVVAALDPGSAVQRGVTVAHPSGSECSRWCSTPPQPAVVFAEKLQNLRALNQVHAELMTSCQCMQVLHHVFMVFGVLCGGGVRLLVVLSLCRRAVCLGDIAARPVRRCSTLGEGNRPWRKSLRCTSFQTNPGVEQMPS